PSDRRPRRPWPPKILLRAGSPFLSIGATLLIAPAVLLVRSILSDTRRTENRRGSDWIIGTWFLSVLVGAATRLDALTVVILSMFNSGFVGLGCRYWPQPMVTFEPSTLDAQKRDTDCSGQRLAQARTDWIQSRLATLSELLRQPV